MKITAFILVFVTAFVYLDACRPLRSGVSWGQSKHIVNKHNFLRDLVADGKIRGQPRGTNFKHMKWDERLAREAQKIASACEFEHKTVADGRWVGVGQNLYTSMSSTEVTIPNWDKAILAWFDEHYEYTYPNDPDYKTGHYTQVVWADSNFIGCGYSAYEEGGLYKQLYVCNYGPAGNLVGTPPYQSPSS